MTTVAQLIECLQTLPPETVVKVAATETCGYSVYTKFEDLDIPIVARGVNPFDYSDNMDFISKLNDDEPRLLLGRT